MSLCRILQPRDSDGSDCVIVGIIDKAYYSRTWYCEYDHTITRYVLDGGYNLDHDGCVNS